MQPQRSRPAPIHVEDLRLARSRRVASVAGSGMWLLASLSVHAVAFAGAIWIGLGRPMGQPTRLEVAPEAPRLLAVLPALDREPEPDPEPWPELLPPPEELPPLPQDELPEVTLEPDVEAPEPPAREQPLPLPQDELARAARAARSRPAPAPPPVPSERPSAAAPPAPRAAPAQRPARAPLVGRTVPTPTWPVGLPWQPADAVVLLFYVRADGSLADVRVESGSGLAHLDEHVRAFVARTWAFEPTGDPRWARNRFVVGAGR